MATGLAPHDGYAIRNAPYQQFSAIVRQWAAESVLPRRITGTRPESTEPTRTGEAPQERAEAQQPTPIATATPKARTVEARARAKRLGAATARLGRRGIRRAQHETRLRRLGRQIEGEKAAIGRAVYPLLERGDLNVDLPEVRERMQKIALLRARLADEHQPRLT